VVAVVIAAICLTALTQVFATGVRAASLGDEYMRAMSIAQDLLAGAGVDKVLNDGTEGGQTADGRFAWTLEVTPEPTDDAESLIRPPLELKRLIARVTIVEDERLRSSKVRRVELTTLLAVPRQLP